MNVFALTHCGFLDCRNQRSARKHREWWSCFIGARFAQRCVCVATGLLISLRCEHDWSLQAHHTISRHDCVIPQTSPFMCCCDSDALPCLRLVAPPLGKRQVCHDWPQHQAPITASLHGGSSDFYVARPLFFLWHTTLTIPRRMLLSAWHALRLADHGLHADLFHEISCRVSSPDDPQTAVEIFKCSTSQFPCRTRVSRCQ